MKDKQSLLLRITCLFWIATKLACYKVWFSEGRLYPVIPPFEFLDDLPPIAHSASFFLSLLGLVLLILFPRKKAFLIGALFVILFSCLLDVMRWQPWEYQCLFFLIIFIINRKNPAALYSAIIFVMGCIYIYSGLHKFNGGYLYTVWENMILRRLLGVSTATIQEWKLHYVGLALALIETLAGVLLLVMRNKKIPAMLLIAMHILLLLMLSGVSISQNRIVLLWNVVMMLILVFFYYKENFRFSMPLMLRGPNLVIVLFWGILPALNFAGYWEKKFSSSLYSGKMKYMDICIKNPEAVPALRDHFSTNDPYNTCNGQARLALSSLAMDETHLLPYPEYWYYRKFKKKWEKLYPGAQAEFVIYQYPFREKEVLK